MRLAVSSTITDLCNERGGTDKGTANGHGYSEAYDRAFAHLRDRPITLVEIGIHMADSLWVWRTFFPNATIAGMDCVLQACLNALTIPGVLAFHLDQGNVNHLHYLRSALPPLDIVIDDACHQPQQQWASFRTLFPKMQSGGIYAIEDVFDDTFTRDAFENYIATGILEYVPADLIAMIARCELIPSRLPGNSLVLVWRK